ncbi:MAG TPA: MltA domain-containing protein, partial [Kiloniellales bacterium]|nr:MltA domain-containing protein [Kiloniellales bacterium]
IDENHVLANEGLELLWLRDYVELFFLQVQGSGIVRFPDGSRQRVGFAAANGLPFTAVGKLLKDSGKLQPGEVTAQGVMAWLRQHPDEAWSFMKQNRRYIFFRMVDGAGPLGSQGVPLTPGRSLAVDPAFLPLGAPLWLDTTEPGSDRPLRRLVVAQDSGAAIKGPVRGDLFWGAGEAALAEAGAMQQKGRYWLLLPVSVAERRE